VSAVLELRDVRAGFGSNTVLHGCSYRVQEFEIAAVLGLNGAGKSVSLKVAAGIVPAWSGQVLLNGEDVTDRSAESRVRRGIGHVPQGRQVFAGLSVEENLRLGGYALRRRDKRRYREVLEYVLERFPLLAERAKQPAGTLSGGQQATLSVARALMSEPTLLIVDEASAGLSPAAIDELFETLAEVRRSGVTILMVEQNVTFTLRIADWVHVMQRGRIVYDGNVESLDTDRVATELGVGRLLGKELRIAAERRTTEVHDAVR
jgi:branched-chain amino acid transport system ATP-binding protein